VLPAVHNAALCYKLIYEGSMKATGKTSHANMLKRKETWLPKGN